MKGRAEQLKWPGCSPAFREIRAFQQYLARIDDGRIQSRQIGRGQHPGQADGIEVMGTVPALDRDDCKITSRSGRLWL